MKARIKGFDDPFKEIETLTMKGVNGTYFVDDVEFEQEPNQLNPEEEKLRHWETIRQQAAIAAMQGLILSKFDYFSEIKISEEAVKCADALVKELKGE